MLDDGLMSGLLADDKFLLLRASGESSFPLVATSFNKTRHAHCKDIKYRFDNILRLHRFISIASIYTLCTVLPFVNLGSCAFASIPLMYCATSFCGRFCHASIVSFDGVIYDANQSMIQIDIVSTILYPVSLWQNV